MDERELPERVALLRDLLVETTVAHRQYEIDELGGAYDEEWAAWYSLYMREHGFYDLLGSATFGSPALEEWLIQADISHRANAADSVWEEYYARFFLGLLPEENPGI